MHVLVGTDDGVVLIGEDGIARAELHGCGAVAEHGRVGRVLGGPRRRLDRRVEAPTAGGHGGQPTPTPPITALLPTGTGSLIGTADARLWFGADGGAAPLSGFDRVAGRHDWHAVGAPRRTCGR